MKILVRPGDDIGPEITEVAMTVIERANTAFGLELGFDFNEVGMASYRKNGTTLPESIFDATKKADGILLGPCGMTEYPPREAGGINVPGMLRKRLDLGSNMRPARTREGMRDARPGLDVMFARENTEGFYPDRNMFMGSGEFMPTPDVALSVRKITAQASRRIAQSAFEYARRRRKQVTVVGKRHVMQLSDGIFVREAEAVARHFPDVTLREMDVDAMAADLYSRPQRHDVILITNMFGDILSNAAVAMSGGLGLAASLNAGDNFAAANAGHGSAPDIAGKGIANPSGLILSCSMLFDWLGHRHQRANFLLAARGIEAAMDAALATAATRTSDLGGTLNTKAFGKVVVDRLAESADKLAKNT